MRASTSIIAHRDVRRVPPPPPPSLSPVVAPLPWQLGVPIAALATFGLLLVQVSLKQTHAHPHVHAERFLWQTNVLLNIAIVYFALELVSPVVHVGFARFRRIPIDLGVFCDYFVLWTLAVTAIVPVELYVGAGDVHVSRPGMVGLYVTLGALLLLRTVAFLKFASSLTYG